MHAEFAPAGAAPALRALRRRSRHGLTLLEILVVVVILGIAGALVVPSMGQVGVLRVQAAVRTVVSDITFIQSDAVAFQEQRAAIFDVDDSTYRLVTVPGDAIDPATNTMYDPTKRGGLYVVDFLHVRFGGSRITDAAFDDDTTLIFDAMGGPVKEPGSNEPGAGGFVEIEGSGQTFVVNVEPFTGRVTVERID